MSFFTYILSSEKLNKYYIGHTNNIQRRISEHNSSQSSSTKSGVPWQLVYCKEFSNITDAVKFELKLKSMKSKKYIKWLIDNNN
ncbi:MAG: GIY-YIG nuclease family protein [Bacteroidetes bacterium]|nr:GIY-YIG nuclease family protein [Bacteroidota bacterium]